jgi:hypothetical protein
LIKHNFSKPVALKRHIEPLQHVLAVCGAPALMALISRIELNQVLTGLAVCLVTVLLGYLIADSLLPRDRGIAETLLWSIPTGVGFSALLDQVSLWIFGANTFFIIATLIVLFFANLCIQRSFQRPKSHIPPLLIFGSSSIAIALVNGGNNPALLLAGAVVMILVVLWYHAQNYNSRFLFSASAVILGIFAGCYFIVTQSADFGPSLLRPLLYGSDDQIYSEQLANSIARFGLGENTAALGQSIRYHWLTLGWSGMVSRIAGLDPWIGTLHIVPYFSAGGICAAAIYAFANQWGEHQKKRNLVNSTWIVLMIPMFLFGTYSVLDDMGAIQVNNTSNLLAHLWIVPMIFVLVNFQARCTVKDCLLFALAGVMLILAKGPYAIPIAAASVSCAIFFLLFEGSKPKDVRPLLVVIALIVSMALAYIGLISDESNSSYTFVMAVFLERFPFPLQSPSRTGILRLAIISVVLVGWLIVRYWFVFLAFNSRLRQFGFIGLGLLVGGLGTFVFDGLGGTSYFLNASIFGSSILILLLLAQLRLVDWFGIASTAIVGLGMVALLVSRLFIPLKFSNIDIWILALPAVGLVLSYILTLGFKKEELTNRVNTSNTFGALGRDVTTHIVALTLTSASVCFGSFAFGARTAVLAREPHSSALISNSELDQLAQIRNISQLNDVFATNRNLCPPTVQLRVCANEMHDPSTLSSHVFSAVIQRRTLIDGPRFVIPAKYWDREYPKWVADRLRATYQYINMSEGSELLAQLGVEFLALHRPSFEVGRSKGWINKSWLEVKSNRTVVLETRDYLVLLVARTGSDDLNTLSGNSLSGNSHQ